MKMYKCLFVLHFVFLLHQSICLQMETVKDTSSTDRDHYKTITKDEKILKMVKQRFLDFLGIKGKPARKPSKRNIKVPDYLWKLYYKWSNDNYEDYDKNNADTARVIYHNVETDHDLRSMTASKQTLYFNVSHIQPKEKLHRAELMLFNERHEHRHKKSIKIYRNKTSNPFTTKKIRHNKVGYVSFDVTSHVNTWLNNSSDDTSLFVDVDDGNNIRSTVHLRKRSCIQAHKNWHHKRPLLVIYTQRSSSGRIQAKQQLRQRRSAYHIKHKDYEFRNKTHQRVRLEVCRLRLFRMDFKTLGRDSWIVAPSHYNLNYCSGHCPRPLGPHFNTTNHAIIQNSIFGLGKNRVPPLCCIPTTLKDQALLHLTGNERLVLINPVQMTALGCGCR
uniref:BMP2/4 n=1 Tax=Podocoryna carnea TaxID=6096 RepID=Q0R0B1_PODCA|nr:BMP2/4 [Podocoryna carnea]